MKKIYSVISLLLLLAIPAFAGTVNVIGSTVPNWIAGVTWDENADTYTRTDVLSRIATATKPADNLLPIHAKMKRCLLADNGTVNYYLCPIDSTKKVDCVTASNLTGADGQVMVEIPAFYLYYNYAGTTHTWKISQQPATGFSLHPAFVKDNANKSYRYIAAYEGSLWDATTSTYTGSFNPIAAHAAAFAVTDNTITAMTGTPYALLAIGDVIVVSGTISNDGTYVISNVTGGNVITTIGALATEVAAATVISPPAVSTANDKLSSVSGKYAYTNITRDNFRSMAANRGAGWRQVDYDLHSAIQLLYLIEYASFYSQSMIGAGISNVTDWAAYNNSYPIARTGNSNSISNSSGNTAGSTSAATESTKYVSYRGVENLFGHIFKFIDGINVNNRVPYVTNVAFFFTDNTDAHYTSLGITMVNVNSWQSTLGQISRGFLPLTGGASSSTKITDAYYQSTGWKTALIGGGASYQGNAGIFCIAFDQASTSTLSFFGSRLAY